MQATATPTIEVASAEPASELSGGEIMCRALAEEGVRYLFGYPGGAIMPFYDALYSCPELQHVLVRHEQAAVHAADGYARITGQPGVAVATSGPGATNMITGLATAFMDSVPLIAITGQVARPAIGKDSFQETDVLGVSMPVTKHNFLVQDVRELAAIIHEAFTIACAGRPGPVLIDVPKDVQFERTTYQPRVHSSRLFDSGARYERTWKPEVEPWNLGLYRAAELLNRAR
jgi:acetolactate synthase-1/2/3 large subunit